MNIERLHQQHAEILTAVVNVRRLLAGGCVQNSDTVAIRLVAMSSIINIHLAAEDTIFYPQLQSAGDATIASLGQQYQTDMGHLLSAHTSFFRLWRAGQDIRNNPEAFGVAANAFFKALHDRIRKENRELYPLVEALHLAEAQAFIEARSNL